MDFILSNTALDNKENAFALPASVSLRSKSRSKRVGRKWTLQDPSTRTPLRDITQEFTPSGFPKKPMFDGSASSPTSAVESFELLSDDDLSFLDNI
mmetsp:Transcript_25868/g.45120  ORF Transcript_25868/g.45120 Transcript_25868/m.45120 type:complete len:96 (-) Transcript_25868:443-730(-)